MKEFEITKNIELYKDKGINVEKLMIKVKANWYWFALSLFIFLGIAYGINRYSQPIYNIGTIMHVSEKVENQGRQGNEEGVRIYDLELNSGMNNMDNQIQLLQSYYHIFSTIKKLNWELSYWTKDFVTNVELYKQSPFTIVFDRYHIQPTGIKFAVNLESDGLIKIAADQKKYGVYNYSEDKEGGIYSDFSLEKRVKPGQIIFGDHYSFYILLNKDNEVSKEEKEYFFNFNNPRDLAYDYQKKLMIEPVKKESTNIRIFMASSIPQKAIEFQNTMVEECIRLNLEKKNKHADNAILFIENQLKNISDSLEMTEEHLQSFRIDNNVLNLSFQADRIFEQVQELEKEKSVLSLKNKYYNYLRDYVQRNEDVSAVLAPSSMGVEDPLLNSLILDLNQLAGERNKLMQTAKEKNLVIPKLDAQIENTKRKLLESTKNIINNSEIALEDIDQRLETLTRKVNRIPTKERQLFGIERKFKLNDNIYNYLLERRAEAQIVKASNVPDNQVVDGARIIEKDPVWPNKPLVYMIALFLGILIPMLIFNSKDYFNNRISSEEDIMNLTRKPILGNVLRSNGKKNQLLFFENPHSPHSEAFRAIRTRLQFLTRKIDNPVVLISSSFSGEGKTFIAVNLAIGYSILRKKTILVDFDLRKPGIGSYFDMNNDNKGVSTFLNGESDFDEVVQHTNIKNLDVITTGFIPSNPSELISDHQNTIELFKELKNRYDYIVIDSPPLGPVCDGYLLAQYVDMNILVARNGYTFKRAFEKTLENVENNEIEEACIVINDVKIGEIGYGYGYGYSYGYGDKVNNKKNGLAVMKKVSVGKN